MSPTDVAIVEFADEAVKNPTPIGLIYALIAAGAAGAGALITKTMRKKQVGH